MSHPTGVREEKVSKKSCRRYKEIIATLPREERASTGVHLYRYQGFWNSDFLLEGTMYVQEKFKAQPTDIFLCSYPKTGTTWLKALSFAIFTRNHFGDLSTTVTNPLLTRNPHECVPHLEFDLVQSTDSREPKLTLLGTHIPYSSLPKSILESGCKIIYICRDPKDSIVSLWHFKKNMDGLQETEKEICFETEFELFCEGKSSYGPFWDHVLGFWNASLESPERVLFLKYEDVKKDTLLCIRRLAEFMNKPFSKEEEDGEVPRKIMELCSISNLSSLEVNKAGKFHMDFFTINKSTYFRKGEVGDWRNHLTGEMMERVDQISRQKFRGSGLTL